MTISVRLSDEDSSLIKQYADLKKMNVSVMIINVRHPKKDAFLTKRQNAEKIWAKTPKNKRPKCRKNLSRNAENDCGFS